MTIVADEYPFVIGVDTHSKNHQYAIVTAAGLLVDEAPFPVTAAGIDRALAWAVRRTGGQQVLASVDGTGSYGRILTRALTTHGIEVVEAPRVRYRPDGKDDRIDARTAAAAVLPQDLTRLTRPKNSGQREAIQILLTAREQLTRDKTRTQNALIALARRYELGIDARHAFTLTHTRTISRWRTRETDDITTTTARTEATRLATHVISLHDQLTANHTTLRELTTQAAPTLLNEPGIGPITAATIYTAWSHHGHIRSEAAFARLAGTAPKPASSGDRTRHRLDRNGNRRLNAALHRIIITRWRNHPDTRAYRDRRRAQGRTDRDIRRALKRIIARHVYRLLEAN